MIENDFFEEFLSRTSMYFSREELNRVKNTEFAIAGLGGVGAIVVELIARWGAKRIRLFDKDRYEISNLNRQIFATSRNIGSYKVDVAKRRIEEINPYAEVKVCIKSRCTYENVFGFLKGSDILIQTTDSPSSLLFYEVARKLRIPLINGYSTVEGGCVCVYDYRHSSCYQLFEKIKDAVKFCGMRKVVDMSPEELDRLDTKWGYEASPTINFVTNTVGCMIVSETIKLITRRGKSIKYPYKLEFNLFSPYLKKKRLYSLLHLPNYKKAAKILKDKLVQLCFL